MHRAVFLVISLSVISFAGQQPIPRPLDPTTPECSASRIVSGGEKFSGYLGRKHVPSSAFVRLVYPLSGTDVMTIYEMGNESRYWQEPEEQRNLEEHSDPDSRLMVTRGGRVLFRYTLKNNIADGDEDWGASLVAMKAVHLCAGTMDVTYLVFQAGNQGGLFLALLKTSDAYRVLEVSDAAQGRIILHSNTPDQVEVWTADDAGACTACPKQFVVKNLKLIDGNYRIVSRFTTRRYYPGFQDSPLVLKPEQFARIAYPPLTSMFRS